MNETDDADTIDPMGNIGARIKRVREARGLTQAQLAAMLGVERGAVGNWELKARPSLENLYNISKKTSVSMEWFMGGPDDIPIPFLDLAAAHVTRIATEPAITLAEAVSIVTLTLLELGEAASEAEARVLARAVIRAYRTPPTPPGTALSDDQRRSAVIEAIRLFRSE
jgi:transcriptional regulator with XRE-family HTH domain